MKKIILDIGANTGYFSEYLLQKVKNTVVIAFEPNLKFKHNLEAMTQKYKDVFKYEAKALSSRNGKSKFYFSSDPQQQLSSVLKPNIKGDWDLYSKKFSINKIYTDEVATCNSLYIKKKYGKEIYFAKIDIQGTDILVASELLSQLTVTFLLIEFQTSSIESEFMYEKQNNSINNLTKLIKKNNLHTIRLFPNSSALTEYNILLSRKKFLEKDDIKFLKLLVDSPILRRYSNIVGVGEAKNPKFILLILRYVLKIDKFFGKNFAGIFFFKKVNY